MIHVVDTHALLWHPEGSPKLGSGAKQVLFDSRDFLIVPTIALAEARYAIARQRTSVTWGDLLAEVDRDQRFVVHLLDIDVLRRVNDSLEMHDAIICATAAVYQEASGESVPLITKDRQIRESGLVQTVW